MTKPLVLLRSPLLTLSGYGNHARQIGDYLLQLEKAGKIELCCEALFWGNTTWIVDQQRDPIVSELMTRCRAVPRQPDVSIQLQLPNEWDPKIAKINIGVTAAVETDVAPSEWIAACDRMDRVVFPSKHSMNSITNAGWKPRDNQVCIIPESFPDTLLRSDVDTSKLDPLPPFTFLIFGQMTVQDSQISCDRKNIHNTVKWLLEEFAGDKDVGVLIKSNMGRNTTFDAYHTENALNQVRKLAQANKPNKQLPELHMVHGDMSDVDVATLYKHPNVKVLVTATRGEGFGLPILEAAACDLPVIATGWSAHCEFLELGRYIDLPCAIKNIPRERVDNRIFVGKARWAEVSETDFKRRVRKFRESPSIPAQWAVDLGKVIRTKYSRSAVVAAWDAALSTLITGEK
jgi:glycosyltransferase involved in cell wall biosynthesis